LAEVLVAFVAAAAAAAGVSGSGGDKDVRLWDLRLIVDVRFGLRFVDKLLLALEVLADVEGIAADVAVAVADDVADIDGGGVVFAVAVPVPVTVDELQPLR